MEFSRAYQIGSSLQSRDAFEYYNANKLITNSDNFPQAVAFENMTSTLNHVLIQELQDLGTPINSRYGIHMIPARGVLSQVGHGIYNLGATLTTIALTNTSGVISGTTWVNGSYYALNIYSTDAWYVHTLTNLTIIKNAVVTNKDLGAKTGEVVTLLVRASSTTAGLTIKTLADGVPANPIQEAFVLTAWAGRNSRSGCT